MGGRKIVEPNLADALKSRNHILDDIFSVKKINVEVKNKAAEDTEESSTPDDLIDSDGRHIVEKAEEYVFFCDFSGYRCVEKQQYKPNQILISFTGLL